jgi:hypothetical protein
MKTIKQSPGYRNSIYVCFTSEFNFDQTSKVSLPKAKLIGMASVPDQLCMTTDTVSFLNKLSKYLFLENCQQSISKKLMCFW